LKDNEPDRQIDYDIRNEYLLQNKLANPLASDLTNQPTNQHPTIQQTTQLVPHTLLLSQQLRSYSTNAQHFMK
jgi:hypothetical protein